jgi:hypothetical protein
MLRKALPPPIAITMTSLSATIAGGFSCFLLKDRQNYRQKHSHPIDLLSCYHYIYIPYDYRQKERRDMYTDKLRLDYLIQIEGSIVEDTEHSPRIWLILDREGQTVGVSPKTQREAIDDAIERGVWPFTP